MKDNKVIAEFMGDEFTLLPDTDGKCYTVKGSWDIIHKDDFIVDKGTFAYNTSWDILMPVVVRLFDDEYNEFDGADDLSFRLNDTLLETNLDSLYRIVVEFINEYNKNI